MESGYMDPKTLVVKFRKGLDPQIQNAVTTMMTRCPSDTTLTAWYKAARDIDQNRASNEAFWSTHCTPTSLSNPLCLSIQPTLQLTQVHVRPTPGHSVPMDIDTSWQRTLITPTCYHCGKADHKVPDCPLQFDIRALMIKELKVELETRLVKRDIVPVEDCLSIMEEISPPDFFLDNKWTAHLHYLPVTTLMSCTWKIQMTLEQKPKTCKNLRFLWLLLQQQTSVLRPITLNGKGHSLRSLL